MKKSVHIVAAVLIAASIGASTTACSASGAAPVTHEASSSSPSATAAVVDRVGQVIPPERATDLPSGQSAFKMSDGTLILVQKDTPLPDAVKADIAAPVAATYSPGQTGTEAESAPISAAIQAAQSEVTRTGRYPIIVFHVVDANFGPTYQATGGAARVGSFTEAGGYPTAAAAHAAAAAFIATQANAPMWEIIDGVS